MAKSPHFERASRSHSSMSLNLISVDRSSIALSVLLCGAIVGDSGQRPRLLRARRERPSGYTAADECDEFPPPHGAYPKAKDHGLSIAGRGPCIAAKAATHCPLRVIDDRCGRSKRPCTSASPQKRTNGRRLAKSALCCGFNWSLQHCS